MVKGSWPWIAPVILAVTAGCNGLAGIREGVFDPCVQDASDPVCSPSSVTASSSSASSSATTGGAGGSRSLCGNGVVDPGEECDDKSPGVHACTQCKVDCAEPGAFKDLATGHCYWILADEMSFSKSSEACPKSPGGLLATITSATELGVIANHVTGSVWIGATELGKSGDFVWLDGEPWAYVAWGPGEPGTSGKDLCVELTGTPLLFGMNDCAQARAALCERGP